MSQLPVTQMTLYKHGVGFFVRHAQVDCSEIRLPFRVSEMSDVLKSLTVVDQGGGQVLGVDYVTPQNEDERLSGCSVRLGDEHSLRDLLMSLRGRMVRFTTGTGKVWMGRLLGLDVPPNPESVGFLWASLLLEDSSQVRAVALSEIRGVDILDERGLADLRFFLDTALTQDEYRDVTIRLTPGAHDLSVSYISPAPTWRVSYRLLFEAKPGCSESDPPADGAYRLLLLGWGIFDNSLEEDLQAIALSLVAGMPISFVYDLYTPFTPERPVIEEEDRVAPGPVEFEAFGSSRQRLESYPNAPAMMMDAAGSLPPRMAKAFALDQAAAAQSAEVSGEALGELFEYAIQTPVTVGRGQSAMVPIVVSSLSGRKDLLYNGTKLPAHPVATLRAENDSGLTLERGPVTVIEHGQYVGEAVLPFTAAAGELVVPYAVELGIRIQEGSGASREIYRLQIKGVYVQIEEWDIRWHTYTVTNKTGKEQRVLVEHARDAQCEVFDTPEPAESTEETYRFAVSVAPWSESVLKVQQRRLLSRSDELRKQSHRGLQAYLRQGLIDQRAYDLISKILMLFDAMAAHEKKLHQVEADRARIFTAQQQIQGNMAALGREGKEGALRDRYVDQLEATERELRSLEQRESELRAAIQLVNQEIESRLAVLG